MVFVEDDDDPAAGSGDESQDEDETMEDADDGMDADATMADDDQGDEDDDQGDDNDDDDEDDLDDPDSPSQARQRDQRTAAAARQSPSTATNNPTVLLTSPSPRPHSASASAPAPSAPRPTRAWQRPRPRPEAVTAHTYDIIPTMASPQSTSINAVAATPDMRWVFSGGSDGYVRMYNWVETANGKVPLTVAQKHPFVDSVMKAGSLTTYWENEEPDGAAGAGSPAVDAKNISPVYALAAQREALWALSGLESGGINLQTCRHQAGTRIATLKEHTSAVSVLVLSADETGVLSGSWDKRILDWDLNTGRVKRTFPGSGGQISALEIRPASGLAIPRLDERVGDVGEGGTFSSNNNAPMADDGLGSPSRRPSQFDGEMDAMGSPDGSLFEENDHGSLFGDNDDGGTGGGGGGGGFGDDDDDNFGETLTNGLEDTGVDVTAAVGAEIMTNGVPEAEPEIPDFPLVPDEDMADPFADVTLQPTDGHEAPADGSGQEDAHPSVFDTEEPPISNGVDSKTETVTSHTATSDSNTATEEGKPEATGISEAAPAMPNGLSTADETPEQDESTFLDAAIDGTLRLWDRRMPEPIAKILPQRGTPPWCMNACWSPDGNTFYAGRRNGTVDEYSIHKGGRMDEPVRTLRFPAGSGAVSAVRAMPNGRGLVCASHDILRLYDLKQDAAALKHSSVPFLIVPGHRTGVISALHIDPACRFMISTAGTRGWEGGSTEVLLGYEINVPSPVGG